MLVVALAALSVSTVLIWREQQFTRAREDSLRRHLYAAQMNLAQQAWEVGHRSHVIEVLERYRSRPRRDGPSWFRVVLPLAAIPARTTGSRWRHTRNKLRPWHSLPTGARWPRRVSTAPSRSGRPVVGGQVDPSWQRPKGTLSVEFSPDGRLAGDGRRPDIERARRSQTLGHENGQRSQPLSVVTKPLVYRVKFSPDGKSLCTVGHDSSRLWDVASYKPIGPPLLHKSPVTTASFSPDGRTIAFAGESPDVVLRELQSGREHILSTGHNGAVSSLAFTADGATLATGSPDWTVKLWNVTTGEERATLSGHAGNINWVAFTPDNRELLTATLGCVIAWNLSAGQVRVLGHFGRTAPIAMSPDAATLAFGLEDGRLELVRLGACAFAFRPHGTRRPFPAACPGALCRLARRLLARRRDLGGARTRRRYPAVGRFERG